MKLKKEGKCYHFEYNDTQYFTMRFSETSIGSWFQQGDYGFTQVSEPDVIMNLEQQVHNIGVGSATPAENLAKDNPAITDEFEVLNKTMTEQVNEMFSIPLEQITEFHRQNHPNKLSYDEWKKTYKVDRWEGFEKLDYLQYLREEPK
jgi:uncharacterized protein YllA (UPF0747 family)